MLLVVSLQLLQEVLRVIQQLKPCSIEPVFLLLNRPLNLLHDYLMTLRLDHVLEQDHTTSQNYHSNFGWIFM